MKKNFQCKHISPVHADVNIYSPIATRNLHGKNHLNLNDSMEIKIKATIQAKETNIPNHNACDV